jgi:hypothetical protein
MGKKYGKKGAGCMKEIKKRKEIGRGIKTRKKSFLAEFTL